MAIPGDLGAGCMLSGEGTAKEKGSVSRPFCLLLSQLEATPL